MFFAMMNIHLLFKDIRSIYNVGEQKVQSLESLGDLVLEIVKEIRINSAFYDNIS